ncbi:TTN [Mytilus coruscus]|uniref:TTN n=1 Tax=Mytilus coruscus TaxID=42192 RepID=A0A6J8CB32_MYTCO|nr:TTN [Mytilus coruscus]
MCCFGEDVKFECTLTVTVETSRWLKDQKESEVPCHWQTKSDCRRKHALAINAVSFEDEGLYSVNVMNDTSEATLSVEDKLLFRSEDIHYILSVHAICKIAIPAFRDVFDKKFPPESLSGIIHKHKGDLVPRLKTNHITSDQWRLLLNGCTSQKLGLRLMVFLLRYIAKLNIKNILPNAADKSELADLSRIDYYRNMTAHYHGRMSDTDFKQCLKVIMEVFIFRVLTPK